MNTFGLGLHRSADIWLNASRTATGEIFNIPLKGEYISIMIKIAAETAIAQMTSVTITVELEGAKAPKLIKIATSHNVTTIKSGNDIEVCSDSRNINQ